MLFSHGARIGTAIKLNILHFAAEHAGKEIVQYLLEQGVDVNGTNKQSETALHLTAERRSGAIHEDVGIAEILLEAGADKEAADWLGETVLIKAAAGRRTHLVQFLLRKGANVRARDCRQSTALHAAAHHFGSRRRSDPEMYSTSQALLDAGADINAEDASQDTVLNLASIGRHHKLESFFVERGAVLVPRSVVMDNTVMDSTLTSLLEEVNRHVCDMQLESSASEGWSMDGQDSFDEV